MAGDYSQIGIDTASGRVLMLNLDKLLDVDALLDSCPIPLGPFKKTIATFIPHLIKKHKVEVKKTDVVDVCVDGAGVNKFLGAQPNAEIYTLQAEKDGAPMFCLVLIGKKPE